MVIKINSKPIKVEEDGEKEWYQEVDWLYLSISTTGYLLALYAMDLVAAVFLGVHPFPFIKFIGVILSWLG